MAAKLMARGSAAIAGRAILRLALTCCIVAMLGFAGCGSSPEPDTELSEAYRLRDSGAGEARLIELSEAADPEVRRAAAVALGSVGGPSSGSALIGLLQDPAPPVRYAAAFALGLLGEVAPLRGLVTADDGNLRLLAVRALGHRGGSADVSLLVDRLAADDLAPVRGEAAIALGRVGARGADPSPGGAARRALAAALVAEMVPEVRWRIAWAIAELGDPVDCAALVGLLDALPAAGRATPAARSGAVFALRALGRCPPERAVVDAVIARLADADVAIARAAIDAAVQAGAQTAVGARVTGALLRCASEHPAPAVRAAACLALAHVGRADADVAVALASACERAEHPVRSAAIEAYAVLAGESAFDAVREGAGAADWRVRAAAARASARLPANQAIGLLDPLLGDADLRVRVAAAETLVAHAAAPVARPAIARLAAERDPALREVAATVFRASGDPALVDAVRTAFDDSDGPVFDYARAALLHAADGLDPSGDETGRWLLAAAEDPSEIVRRAAAAALARRGAPLPDRARRRDPVVDPVPGAGIPPVFLGLGPVVRFRTRHGEFDVELAPQGAPVHAWKLLQFAAAGSYDGRLFHHVVPGNVVHGGDARADGYDVGGARLRGEINPMPFLAGTVGAWRPAGRQRAGDEFFITLLPAPELDGEFTAFGRVVRGLDVVERIEEGDAVEQAVVLPAGTEAPMPSAGR